MPKRSREELLRDISVMERSIQGQNAARQPVLGAPPLPEAPANLPGGGLMQPAKAPELAPPPLEESGLWISPEGKIKFHPKKFVRELGEGLLPINVLIGDVLMGGAEKIMEKRRGTPAQRALKAYTGSGEGIISEPLAPFEDSTEEANFQTAYRTLAVKMGIETDPDHPLHKYDYRRAYKAGELNADGGHFSSQFKLPGHPRLIVEGRDTRTGRRIQNVQATKRAKQSQQRKFK